MNRKSPAAGASPELLTAMGMGLLSTMVCGVALLAIVLGQMVAQRPAFEGVMVVHLSRRGELRLWNQPIRAQDMPVVLDKLRNRHPRAPSLLVRVVPEHEVPWGVVHRVIHHLRPTRPSDTWTLQLQLP
jgi:hypothetical protein